MAAGDELMLALDGPGINPETVDSLVLLQLAEAWFRLSLKIAEASKIGLSFTGLSVVRKCAAVVAHVSDVGSARTVTARAVRVVAGAEPVPEGAGEASDRFGRAFRALPATHSVRVRVGAKWLPLKRPPPVFESDTPWEIVEMRATPIRVGGKDPRAQFVCDGESDAFTLSVSIEDARVLGANLQRPIDVTTQVCRHTDGRIERGRVIDVTPLENVDPIVAWRTWFADDAVAWDDVSDIGVELGHS